ncbi:MAG: hypothetical protein Unbinned5930contig1000_5 [Prokaryotic dsDNA virus sp.]|mgnify:CR=1 FL=1|nr:MAG: hypothetical protein Unbinned5930contig1000_5 [Prokaryotic dsDNA virus sp.]
MGVSIKKILENFDLTSIFKDKRFGDLKRWSAKRTVGGVVVAYALSSMNGAITWEGLVMCGIGVLPLCLSMFEGRGKNCNNCKCK